MNKPIIDPSTLTEEQRKKIIAIYTRKIYGPEDMERKFTEECLLEALFGSEFFKKPKTKV